MKVLITTDLYTTDTNGVVTSVKNLVEVLQARGHQVRILTVADDVHSCRIGNVYYIRSLPIGFIYPDIRMPTSYRHRLIKELIKWQPDVIHSQCEFFSYQFASHISKKTGAPVVHTYHTLYEQYAAYLLRIKGVGEKAVGKFSRIRLKKTDRIIAPTRKVEDVLRSYGITVPISVVPSGIRLEQHQNRLTLEQRAEGRKALGIDPEAPLLVSVGRVGNEKKLDDLLNYFAKVSPEHEDLRFLIVGGGPAKESLEKLAVTLEIQDRVVFAGMVAPDKVQDYYQLGDIFVCASTSETQGLTYVEASANGLPLLCRKDPCLKDVMVEGENGYAFTDADSFREGLDKMLANPQWREQAGQRSREIAAGFGKEAFGAAVEKVYHSVIKKPVASGERK
ncbi:MAG: glycosyltransferase [Oscillospiraceae bacterium]|nr:glycosyltransferase [Oscillospiraceae bacterium]